MNPQQQERYDLMIRQGYPPEEAYRMVMRDSMFGAQDNFTGPTGDNPYNFNPEDELDTPSVNVTKVSADMALNPTKYAASLRTNVPIGSEVDDKGRIIAPASSGRSRFDTRFGVDTPDYSSMIDPKMSREENIQMLMSGEYGAGLSEEDAAAAYDGTASTNTAGDLNQEYGAFPYINPWGGDMNTNAYMLGRSIGADKGTRGRTLGIVSGVGNLGLGLARTIGSGIANESETQRNYLDFLERRNRASRQYTNQQTSRDQNYMGGSMYQDGGEHGGGDNRRKEYEGKSYFYSNSDDYKKWKTAAKYGSGQMSPSDAMVLNVPGEGQAHIPLNQFTPEDYDRYNRYAMLQDMSVNGKVELSPQEKAEVKQMRKELGFSFEEGGIFRKRYGDVDYKEYSDERVEGMSPGLSVNRRQARDIRRTVNRNIRSGYVDDSGLDYSQFARTKTKDFMVEAPNRQVFEGGGEMPTQETPQPQVDPDTQEEIQVLATQLSEEFKTIEEAASYLEEQGIEPQMAEMILEVFRMIKEEQGVTEGQPEPPKSQIMRDNMSSGMEVDMGFKYGGRKQKIYPKL